ncbi:MAG TPA: alpha-1,4-glucan--maltose-1-phosphate maltosyltransferase [Gammaproteobacteria bacterium]|nr:alpha-1,4-glucan--maltose-1-phosphate maltosyltransferase [Gammaproteobacteria bacterium]
MEWPEDGRRRAFIEQLRPVVDCGRAAIKRVLGEAIEVEADVLVEGHEQIACALLHAPPGSSAWTTVPMTPLGDDCWTATFTPATLGRHRYTVAAWLDAFATWRSKLIRRIARDDIELALREGAVLVRAAAGRARGAERGALLAYAAMLESEAPIDERRRSALTEALRELMTAAPDRALESVYDPPLEAVVERPLARFSAWYEFFPRSAVDAGQRHGTLATAARRLGYVAEMGFDVVYLPPIHPIGTSHRKGPNNRLQAAEADPGSPWAIGGAGGGHKSVHAELGTLDDFKAFRSEAERLGLEVALDLAFQCSPDHPYVAEHPLWFARRPDGSVQYAENPPKKYEDIYPLDFGSAEWRGLWQELNDVVEFWIAAGVRVFRVDNPHTKPFDFWRWLIADVQSRHPDTLFLSEAFTRPRVMFRLAKLGFSQSYTYFTWRNSKQELTDYFTELKFRLDYFRPNLWPNTPDILHEHLQTGGRPAFMARAALAATLGASYGIYGPAFELLEHEPREAGSEEYLDSEKYEVRVWDLERAGSLRDFLARLNAIRRANPALHSDATLRFLTIDNDQLICYSKHGDDGANVILVVVNLDPQHAQSGFIDVPLEEWGLDAQNPYGAHELLTDSRHEWQGARVFVTLAPAECPACVYRIEARRSTSEHDFDYFI